MGRRVLTVPNALTLVRLLCIPLFLWLLFEADEPTASFLLLGALGATDWVDGWVARHFDQGSELGKVLDPVADRVLLLTAAIALMVYGAVPVWVGVAVLVREAVVGITTLALALAGARRIDVLWVGKTGAFFLMFALPGFLWLDTLGPGAYHDVVAVVTWTLTALGLAFSYYAAFTYVPLARQALRDGRADRERAAHASGASGESSPEVPA